MSNTKKPSGKKVSGSAAEPTKPASPATPAAAPTPAAPPPPGAARPSEAVAKKPAAPAAPAKRPAAEATPSEKPAEKPAEKQAAKPAEKAAAKPAEKAAAKPASQKSAAKDSKTMPGGVTPEERYRMIQDAAYFRAEKRGFVGGDPGQDWIEAEQEIDMLLRKRGKRG